MSHRPWKTGLELVILLALLPVTAVGQVQDPTYSAPADRTSYVRPLSAEDRNPLGSATGATVPSAFLRNLVVSNTNPSLFNNDTANDGEPSIAINPNNPDEIVILAFSGGWGGGAAPLWHSTDGGLTWSKRNTIANPGVYGSNCPCDQAPDWGMDGNLYITFLECQGNAGCDIVTGSTADPTSLAAWNWSDDGLGNAEVLNQNPVLSSDQPWLLVNIDPNNPLAELVHNAYDDFSVAPRGMQVMTAPNADPPDFNSDDDNVGSAGTGVNPGHRQAKDPRTGYIYSAWQNNVAGGADPKNINYMLNRSIDGGVSWTLNGSATGWNPVSGLSTQPTPKFGTVNALLGGVLHVAVDPNLGHVYYVYGDQDGSGFDRLSIARLEDDGTGTLFVAGDVDLTGQVEAAIPSVAVADDSTVGVFYYTFDGFSSDSIPIFSAWLALSSDLGVTFEKQLLLSFLSSATDLCLPPGPPPGVDCNRQRVLGDYVQMKTVGRTFYGTFTGNGAPFGRPISNHDPYFFKQTVGPIIAINAPNDFGILCDGESRTQTLEITNTGPDPLVVQDLSVVAGGDPEITLLANPSTPATLDAGDHLGFTVQCSAGTPGTKSATIRISSNDPDQPLIDVPYTCEVGAADILTFIADSGDFGDVCVDAFMDLNLTIQNNGTCDLEIGSLTLGGPDAAEFELPDGSLAGTLVEPGNSLLVPIRFAPGSCGADASAILDLASNDPDTADALQGLRQAVPADVFADGFESGDTAAWGGAPAADVGDPIFIGLGGTAPCPDINVAIADSGDFGAVCKSQHADLDLTLFNQGRCDLTISDIELLPDADSFELPDALTFPLVLSHDADFRVPIRFAPEDCFDTPESRTLQITSDDPDEPMLDVDLSGVSPCPNLVIDPVGLTSLFSFPPTVVDTGGSLGCFSERSLDLRNSGACPLTIDDISAAGGDFAVTEPTVFPILLPAGEETLSVTVRFTPQSDADPLAPNEVAGLLSVVSDDPDGAANADLCGESVAQSGLRILVTDISTGAPVPIAEVDSITIMSKGQNTPGPINLRFTDQPLFSAAVCGNDIFYHVDQEDLPETETSGSNPRSSYESKAKEGNLQATDSFGLGQCELRDFQLQLRN